MGWTTALINNVDTVTGPIGDPLGLQVVAEFYGEVDFSGNTWLCQIRHTLASEDAITLSLTSETQTVEDVPVDEYNTTGKLTTLSLLFDLADTTVLTAGREYVWGVKAVDGPDSPFTLVPEAPLLGYGVVPRVDPP